MTVEIELTKGYVALVDDDDADLAEWPWYALVSRACVYAARMSKPGADGKRMQLKMHMIVADRCGKVEPGKLVDHANGDSLDNRRGNLRPATKRENAINSSAHAGNTSGFKGVSRPANCSRWRACIKAPDGILYLGLFNTATDAALAYDRAAREIHGEFARLNFPLK